MKEKLIEKAIRLIVDRSYVKAGTIVCMFCGGPIIDFFTWCLGRLGIGTLICAFLVGPVAEKCMPFSDRIVAASLRKLQKI